MIAGMNLTTDVYKVVQSLTWHSLLLGARLCAVRKCNKHPARKLGLLFLIRGDALHMREIDIGRHYQV